MREKTIEAKLRSEIAARMGLCWKFSSPSHVGVPDRLIFLPDKRFYMVETKAPGKKPRLSQAMIHAILEGKGFKVWVVSTLEELDAFLKMIDNE